MHTNSTLNTLATGVARVYPLMKICLLCIGRTICICVWVRCDWRRSIYHLPDSGGGAPKGAPDAVQFIQRCPIRFQRFKELLVMSPSSLHSWLTSPSSNAAQGSGQPQHLLVRAAVNTPTRPGLAQGVPSQGGRQLDALWQLSVECSAHCRRAQWTCREGVDLSLGVLFKGAICNLFFDLRFYFSVQFVYFQVIYHKSLACVLSYSYM